MSGIYRSVKPSLDQIMALNSIFLKDVNPNKMNLIIGSYRTRLGKPYVFKSVETAINILSKKEKNFEYLPITGDQEYLEKSKELYFGKKTDFDNVQSLSGTGALKLAGDLIGQTFNSKTIYVPNPTWENHHNIFKNCGLTVKTYNYLNKIGKFNVDYIYDNIRKIENGNIVLFHACAHNPTGYDISYDSWKEIMELCFAKNLFPLIDMAYLGFASGNLNKDLTVLKILNAMDNYPSAVCTSYSKNFGLYCARAGNLFFRGENPTMTINMKDTLRQIIRTNYSNPPSYGSDIIKTVLGSNEITKVWMHELVEINEHYVSIRNKLRKELETKLNRDFSAITKQTGMFYYGFSEFSTDEILHMRKNGVYFLDTGRISLAGLNDENIERFVKLMQNK